MQFRHLLTVILLGLVPAASAQAENSIGVWRWLGMGWGPGYHSGTARHGHHERHHQQFGQVPSPAWEESWPVNPTANPRPLLEPVPAADELNAEESVITGGSPARSSLMVPPPKPGLELHGHFESSRQTRFAP